MNIVSICDSEEYYYIKNNKNKKTLLEIKEKKENEVNKKSKNLAIKSNGVYYSYVDKIIKNNRNKDSPTSKDFKKSKVKRTTSQGKKNVINVLNDNYTEEDQLEFELSLEDIEKSFDETSLDLLKHDQLEDPEFVDYEPMIYEEEQLQFDLTLEEIEESINKFSLDLFKVDQLDCDINDIDAEAQAYENKVELEFEYSDSE